MDRDVPEHVGVLSTAAIPNKHLDSYLITIEHKDYIGLDPVNRFWDTFLFPLISPLFITLGFLVALTFFTYYRYFTPVC